MDAAEIYFRYLHPGAVDIEGAVAAGMIRKADLVDGAQYKGHCRNATTAAWDATKQKFTYLRKKFGDEFLEDIEHPEDDKGFDVFVPTKRL